MILYSDACYSLSDYKKIRQKNRKSFKLDINYYCEKQLEFEHNYEFSIEGVKYISNNWFKGLKDLKRKYGVNLIKYKSFPMMYSMNTSLPKEVDYIISNKEEGFSNRMQYISRECKFEVYTVENRVNVKKFYGDNELITKIIMGDNIDDKT